MNFGNLIAVFIRHVFKPLAIFGGASLPFYVILLLISGEDSLSKYEETNLRSVWINNVLSEADYGTPGQLNPTKTQSIFSPFIKKGLYVQCVQMVGLTQIPGVDRFKLEGIVTYSHPDPSSEFNYISVPFVSVYKKTLAGVFGLVSEYDSDSMVQAYEPVISYLPYSGLLPEVFVPINKATSALKAPAFLTQDGEECPDARGMGFSQSQLAYKPMAVKDELDERLAIAYMSSTNPDRYLSKNEMATYLAAEKERIRLNRQRELDSALRSAFGSFIKMISKSF